VQCWEKLTIYIQGRHDLFDDLILDSAVRVCATVMLNATERTSA
jgi:hypothetical protein